MGTLMDKLNRAVTNPNTRIEVAVSDEAIVLKMQHVIELAISKGKDNYGYQFAATEVARQFDGIDGIEDCTEKGLDNWASQIVIRMIQQRGQVPANWIKKSKCAHCGDVWSDHGIDTLSCGWCWMRIAGNEFPRP